MASWTLVREIAVGDLPDSDDPIADPADFPAGGDSAVTELGSFLGYLDFNEGAAGFEFYVRIIDSDGDPNHWLDSSGVSFTYRIVEKWTDGAGVDDCTASVQYGDGLGAKTFKHSRHRGQVLQAGRKYTVIFDATNLPSGDEDYLQLLMRSI